MLNVKKSNWLSIVFILLLSCYFSCESIQKKSLQNDILKIDYYVRYLQSDKQVKAEISFSEVVDSTKKIMPKRMVEVLFQENALDGKRIKDRYKYQLTKNISFADTFNFTYRANTTQGVANQFITINPIIDFSIKKNKVSKLGGTILTLIGNPLQQEESIIILLSDANNKTITFLAKELTFNILPEKVKDLASGKGTIYVVRKHSSTADSEVQQLTGLTEYYSEVKEIEIVE